MVSSKSFPLMGSTWGFKLSPFVYRQYFSKTAQNKCLSFTDCFHHPIGETNWEMNSHKQCHYITAVESLPPLAACISFKYIDKHRLFCLQLVYTIRKGSSVWPLSTQPLHVMPCHTPACKYSKPKSSKEVESSRKGQVWRDTSPTTFRGISREWSW